MQVAEAEPENVTDGGADIAQGFGVEGVGRKLCEFERGDRSRESSLRGLKR